MNTKLSQQPVLSRKGRQSLNDPNIYADLKQLIALQHQASGYSFLPRQPVHSVLSGRHASKLRGRGLNFEELRHYRMGDDIRTMDWKVSNRTGKPHVRVYTEERERPVLLLIDQRMSLFFGSRVKMKSVVAAELAALSAWRVIASGDRVGALVFNDKQIIDIRPRRSRKTTTRILDQTVKFNHALCAYYPDSSNEAQLNNALAAAERVSGHDALIVIISDMSGSDAETLKRIKRLGRHNDVMVALVYDELEKTLPTHSQLILSDGNMQIEVDAAHEGLGDRFEQQFHSQVQVLQAELQKHAIPVMPVNTHQPVIEQIRKAIGERLTTARK